MEMTGKVLREVEFRDRLRGYDTDEVDEFLEEVAVAVDGLHARIAELTGQLARTASGDGAPPADVMPVFDDESIRRTLVLAQRTADLAIKEANEEAQRLLESARREADALVTQASENARRLREEADEEYASRVSVQLAQREQLEREVRQLGALVIEERGRIVDSLQTLLRYVTDNVALSSDLALRAAREPEPAGGEAAEPRPVVAPGGQESLAFTTPLPVVPPGGAPNGDAVDDELWERWSDDGLDDGPAGDSDPFGFNRRS